MSEPGLNGSNSPGVVASLDHGTCHAYKWLHVMDLFRHRSLRIVCALLAFLLLGDIVADGIHDASGLCATESQESGHDSCPACAQCTIHTGAALAPDAIAFLSSVPDVTGSVSLTDDRPALGAPPAIDHPPQLA